MKIITYHAGREPSATDSMQRAAQRGKRRLHGWKWDLMRFAFLGIAGPLLHRFAPVLIRFPVLPGLVPVNESIWEHLKLLFFPALLFCIAERCIRGPLYRGLLTTCAQALLSAMGLMIAGFYTYAGVLGCHTLSLDILLYYLCALFLTLRMRARASTQKKSSLPGLLMLLLMTGCFFYLTYHPMPLGIFQRP